MLRVQELFEAEAAAAPAVGVVAVVGPGFGLVKHSGLPAKTGPNKKFEALKMRTLKVV